MLRCLGVCGLSRLDFLVARESQLIFLIAEQKTLM